MDDQRSGRRNRLRNEVVAAGSCWSQERGGGRSRHVPFQRQRLASGNDGKGGAAPLLAEEVDDGKRSAGRRTDGQRQRFRSGQMRHIAHREGQGDGGFHRGLMESSRSRTARQRRSLPKPLVSPRSRPPRSRSGQRVGPSPTTSTAGRRPERRASGGRRVGPRRRSAGSWSGSPTDLQW